MMSYEKIIICAPTFLNFGGGISSFSRALALALKSDNPILIGKLDQKGSYEDILVSGCGSFPKTLQNILFALLLIQVAFLRRPKIIISTHLNFGPVLFWIRKILNIPYILVAHGIDVSPSLSMQRQQALRMADGIWAVSKWTQQKLVELDVSPDLIQIIPNTVSNQSFGLASQNLGLRERYGIGQDEKIVLTVARLDKEEAYKGYDKVVAALPSILNVLKVHFIVVGRGEDGVRLLSIGNKLGVAGSITLCGFVSDNELADHYRLADVFAMPSMGEGFGIVFLEAMACGIPVLGGNQDGSVDALLNGKLGLLVNPNDVEEIAKGLIDILQKQGPSIWFSPIKLREACLDNYGPDIFKSKVRDALRIIDLKS